MREVGQFALTIAYEDMERLLCGVVHKFRRRYQLQERFEETLSDAHVHFIAAYRRYESSKGELSTWLSLRVYFCLLGGLKTRAIKALNPNTPKREYHNLARVPAPKPNGLGHVLQDLGQDAAKVVKLLAMPPVELDWKANRPKSIKRKLVGYLRDLGWSMGQILDSFQEITEALHE